MNALDCVLFLKVTLCHMGSTTHFLIKHPWKAFTNVPPTPLGLENHPFPRTIENIGPVKAIVVKLAKLADSTDHLAPYNGVPRYDQRL